ncbi:MAG TPA: type II CAAX endopeptidase family protein [Candidatus Acidoferrales bacterium]|nr:type II CAAX endopeptidase family protein [Candidatus Acidoferrales bacterium]
MSDATHPQPDQITPSAVSTSRLKLLAPVWHTVALVVFLFAFSALGYIGTRRLIHTGPNAAAPSPMRMLPTYLGTLLFEWVIFFFVYWGEKRYSGATLRERIGGRWASARDVWRDIGLGFSLWIAASILNAASNSVLHPSGTKTVLKLLPHVAWQLIPWVLISASAGFCEEYVFRGYLMEQLRRMTGVAWLAIVLQALIFGIGHGYQGLALMFSIFLLGLAFGVAANSLKSLRPCMIAHGVTDTFGGVAGYFINAYHLVKIL